ncbi:hypothetical protein [Veillonella caviae]|uniref:hypothetical protein n=1 Tax=Veillonella caviae TaxID=248316 RepID=UPI000F8DFF90|nr:hypothetical protein [Veillonella caviae]
MKILVKKGYLAHQGQLFGKGKIVDIADKAIAKALLANEQFAEYKDPEADTKKEDKVDTKSDDSVKATTENEEPEDVEDTKEATLPSADATKAVKKK